MAIMKPGICTTGNLSSTDHCIENPTPPKTVFRWQGQWKKGTVIGTCARFHNAVTLMSGGRKYIVESCDVMTLSDYVYTKYFSVIFSWEWGHRTASEMAARLGCSVPAARYRIRAAKRAGGNPIAQSETITSGR